ncbi:hypothetical protein Tco_0442214 [Tanacetum coccineum]
MQLVHDIHRMYIDGGASADILYEHCFQRLRPEVKSQLNPATTSLTGFTGEKIWPMGQLRLPVMVGNKEHSTTAWMNFMVIRSPSPYNGIYREDRDLGDTRVPNPSQHTSHSPCSKQPKVYEEGRLPLDYRSRRSFHAAQAAYSSTSHASRTPTRGGVDNIFIRDAWGN